MGRVPKWAFWTSGSVLCVILLPVGYVLSIPKVKLASKAQIDTMRLVHPRTLPSGSVTTKENAFYYLWEAHLAYREALHTSERWNGFQPDPSVERYYRANGKAIEFLRKGISKSEISALDIEEKDLILLGGSCAEILQLMARYARHLFTIGRQDEAVALLTTSVAGADRLTKWSIDPAACFTVRGSIVRHVFDALSHHQVTPKNARKLLKLYALQDPPSKPVGSLAENWYEKSFRAIASYPKIVRAWQVPENDIVIKSGRFDQLATLEHLNRAYRAYFDNWMKPKATWGPALSRVLDDVYVQANQAKDLLNASKKSGIQKTWDRVKFDLMPNSVGSVYLLEAWIWPAGNYHTARLTDIESAKLFTAIAIYNLEHKRFPADVQKLIDTGLLRDHPVDYFSGKPLQYDPKRKIIWSVGANMKDENGTPVPGTFTPPIYPKGWKTFYLDADMVWQLPK